MQKFSEAFEAARTAVQAGDFAGAVGELKSKLKLLMGPDGPVSGEANQLAALRDVIDKAGAKLVAASKASTADAAAAQVMIEAAGIVKKQERAATLKMLKHLYHEQSSGSQTIWVYAPP